MEKEALRPRHSLRERIFLGIVALTSLALIYFFQKFNVLQAFGIPPEHIHPNVLFIVNKVLRLLLNDAACLLLVYALFQESKYLKIAFFVFLVEITLILPLYLAFKLSLEGASELSSPLLSQIHRLIVNPTLMLLLIAGFYYQKMKRKKVG